jgi:hypothetical protein
MAASLCVWVVRGSGKSRQAMKRFLFCVRLRVEMVRMVCVVCYGGEGKEGAQ